MPLGRFPGEQNYCRIPNFAAGIPGMIGKSTGMVFVKKPNIPAHRLLNLAGIVVLQMLPIGRVRPGGGLATVFSMEPDRLFRTRNAAEGTQH
jgi:hypothetical protein